MGRSHCRGPTQARAQPDDTGETRSTEAGERRDTRQSPGHARRPRPAPMTKPSVTTYCTRRRRKDACGAVRASQPLIPHGGLFGESWLRRQGKPEAAAAAAVLFDADTPAVSFDDAP